ncbi:FIST signal transduction protein [Paucibacter soli]|uniref:FIST signal transduction protein n=1 Tax=Paucibacter soli TaxID=3133433 RepID=UPI00309FEC77
MPAFAHAHATHPDAHLALALAAAQLEAQCSQQGSSSGLRPTLGWIYLTEAFAPKAPALLAELQQRWPGVAWVGASGVGVCATGVEYFDEPALALMLAELPREQFRVFSGTRPLGAWRAECAQVHADGSSTELQELIAELAGLTQAGYLFGGLASGRRQALQIADGIWQGGLSGVAFTAALGMVSRVSQGCQALGPERRITACDGNLVTALDGRPALDCLLQDLSLPALTAASDMREALPRLRRTLVGLRQGGSQGHGGRAYGPEVQVRHLIGIDPAQRAVAVAERLQQGQVLSFCERHAEAARRDLMRICTEIRDECESLAAARPGAGQIAGAVYISCAGRGGPHFGAPSAELQWLRHALGDVPLVGFFAGGEIAHDKLYGYTGVLTVFLQPSS